MHFRFTGGGGAPTTADINAMDAVVRRLYGGAAYSGGAAWLTLCQNNVQLIDSTHYVLNGTSVPVINTNAIVATGGTAAMAPQEVAIVITLRTNIRGRSYRGRVYLPAPLTAQFAATGNLSSTVAAQVVSQCVGLNAALGAINWEWVVASYLHSTAEKVTAWTVDTRPDVQRRRKR